MTSTASTGRRTCPSLALRVPRIAVSTTTRTLPEAAVAHGPPTAGGVAAAPCQVPAFAACHRLTLSLAALAGAGVSCSLLTRALAMTCVEHPLLRRLQVSESGCLQGLASIRPPLCPARLAASEGLLLAHMFHLLSAFLGEALALRLVEDASLAMPRAAAANSPSH